MISQEKNDRSAKRKPADAQKRTGTQSSAAKKRASSDPRSASGKSTKSASGSSGKRPSSTQRPAGNQRPASGQRPTNGQRAPGAQRTASGSRPAGAQRSPGGQRPANGQRPTGAQRAAGRRPQPGKKKKSPMLIVLAAILAVVIVVFAGVGIYAMRYAGYDKIMPNVFVAGVDIGGMTKEEAKAAIEAELQKNADQSLNVILPDQVLTFAPKADTIRMDVDSAVDEAYAYGRKSTSPFAISRAIKAAQRHKNEISLASSITVDSDYINELISSANDTVRTEMQDSNVVVDPDSHTINVTIGSPGKGLKTEELYTLVSNAFINSDYSDITTDYEMTYPATVQLDKLYEELTTEPENASYNKETGEVDPEVPGFVPTLPLDKANEQLATAAPGDELTFTFEHTDPEITAEQLNALLFRDTLKSYGSWYSGNYNRTINLELACDAINGTVLAPGDVFSFNDVVGERTTEKGYREATVFVSGNSKPEAGGGVCQVASTIYYCAMYADLEIVERSEHEFEVDYVPEGLDATVYFGSLDFQFKNSTDYPIKIYAYLSGGRCWIELIGTNIDGKYCEIDNERTAYEAAGVSYTTDASKVQSGYNGSTWVLTRRVYNNDGLVRTDTTEDLDNMATRGRLGTSRYSKRDSVIFGGAATATPSPSTSPSPSTEPTTPTPEQPTPTPEQPTPPPVEPTPPPVEPVDPGTGGETPPAA